MHMGGGGGGLTSIDPTSNRLILLKAPNPHSFAMESVKICHFKTFRVGNSALRTLCCFFSHYIRVKQIVLRRYFNRICQYEFKSVKFKG